MRIWEEIGTPVIDLWNLTILSGYLNKFKQNSSWSSLNFWSMTMCKSPKWQPEQKQEFHHFLLNIMKAGVIP